MGYLRKTRRRNDDQRKLGTEHCSETVAIVDIIVIDVRAGVIAGVPGIVVIVLLG
jgi:hypothetical protein